MPSRLFIFQWMCLDVFILFFQSFWTVDYCSIILCRQDSCLARISPLYPIIAFARRRAELIYIYIFCAWNGIFKWVAAWMMPYPTDMRTKFEAIEILWLEEYTSFVFIRSGENISSTHICCAKDVHPPYQQSFGHPIDRWTDRQTTNIQD